MTISNYIRSWILLVPLIPSILVSIFNLYHFLSNRTLRKALNNHAIILLLICGLIETLTDIPWNIHYLRTDTILSSAPVFCRFWAFIGPSMYVSVFILMAWASIERHILIFYPNWVRTKTTRFFFHYSPLAICILCPMIFYFIIFIILPCNIPIRYNGRLCNIYNCVSGNFIRRMWDSIVNFIMPAFITVIFSLILFVRVIYSRYRIRQRIEWRNYKKMALQLLPISILYILLQFPPIILYAAYSAGLPSNIAGDYYNDTLFFTFWIILLNPFACAMSLPDLRTKCRNVVLFWRRRGVIVPTILMTVRPKVGQTGTVVPTTRFIVINHAKENAVDRVLELSGGQGVDIVYDSTYLESSFEKSTKTVKEDGSWIVLDQEGSKEAKSVAERKAKLVHADMARYWLGSERAQLKTLVHNTLIQGAKWIEEGKLKSYINQTIKLEEVENALNQIKQGKAGFGKVVVKIL